jgi:uncharacterized protein YggE
MQHAIKKAKTLAGAAGVKTGQILEISEQSFSPRSMPMVRAEMPRAGQLIPYQWPLGRTPTR